MAIQVVDAMAPFAGAGIIDMPKLAGYVLQYGFGIKDGASFIIQPPPMGPEPQPAPPSQAADASREQMMPQGPPPGSHRKVCLLRGMPPQGGMPGGWLLNLLLFLQRY
jgi:hypothetical protein